MKETIYRFGEVVDLTIHKRQYGKGLDRHHPVCGTFDNKLGWFARIWDHVNCKKCLALRKKAKLS